MDNNSKFWLFLWGIVLTAVISFTAIVSTSVVVTDYVQLKTMAAMVAGGTDPRAARCAVYDRQSELYCSQK